MADTLWVAALNLAALSALADLGTRSSAMRNVDHIVPLRFEGVNGLKNQGNQ
jgi:hypothetical protein